MPIKIYEDDPGHPGPGTLIDAAEPAIEGVPFAFKFPAPPQPQDPNPASKGFRYWNAAATLRRGVEFWSPLVTLGKWHRGPTLAVVLEKGEDLNSNYDRQALNFYRGKLRIRGQQEIDVFAAASPDMLCHELGHAILDAINPQLWNTASQEIAAFHESFGDMSALLCSLQLPSFCQSILSDTGGHLFLNSRLSRIAEQFGIAVHAENPEQAEADCLRNAFNAFNYDNPVNLPNHAPATNLSSDSHSFSRIFTGALFEAMAGMLDVVAGNAERTPDHLLTVTQHMRKIMVDGIKNTDVVPNYFAQVAAAMVEKSFNSNPAYPAIFRSIFVRRGIISLVTASAIVPQPGNGGTNATWARAHARDDGTRNVVELPSSSYGWGGTLLVSTPSSPRHFIAKSALSDSKPMEPLSALRAATAYVDELFANDQVQVDELGEREREQLKRPKTHYLDRDGGVVRLARFSFN